MRLLALAMLAVASAAYGPPPSSNPFTRNSCGSGGCGQATSSSSGCSGGCSGGQQFTKQTFSCGGSGCPPSDKYWWEGDNSPFSVPPGHQVTNVDTNCRGSGCSSSITTCGGANCPPAHQFSSPQPQRPISQPHTPQFQPQRPPQPQTPSFVPQQQQPARPNPPVNVNNLVMPPMGICPATFVCVHWQLCRDGFVITDGTGAIDKRIKDVPAQIASAFQSCGTNMLCCGVPSYNPPPVSNVPNIPFDLPNPAPQAPPAFQQPPTARPTRPTQRPTPRPPQPPPASNPSTGGYTFPSPPQNPLRPLPQTPNRPLRPSVPTGQYGPNPQSTSVNQANPVPLQPSNNPQRPARPPSQRPQPNVPISNPVGLVSPPSPQPMGMMGGMMGGMMMPLRGGSCSAGTYCVQPDQCNPYTGFIIRDPTQLMAVWPDAPTVPLLSCFVPGAGQIQNGVCCQEAHPRAGGLD